MRGNQVSRLAVSIFANFVGPELIDGFILGLLNGVTPEICLEYIRQDRQIFDTNKVIKFRPFADQIKYAMEYTDAKDAINKLAKGRFDLACVILNHPSGLDWLQRQIGGILEILTAKEVSLGIDRDVDWRVASCP